jgi:hypothetical protein
VKHYNKEQRALAGWAAKQRKAYTDGSLDKDHKQQLAGIGFEWVFKKDKEPDTSAAAAAAGSATPPGSEHRAPACPSPWALSSTSSATNQEEDSKPPGIRIVDEKNI